MHPPPAVKMAPNAPRRHPGPGVPRQQQQVQGPQQLQGPQTAAGHSHPAVVSLKKEIGVALDASQPLVSRGAAKLSTGLQRQRCAPKNVLLYLICQWLMVPSRQ
jgi:hypothetical protein